MRLHPDKPGGDTAKFQQLQASYQELLRRRKTAAEEGDIEGTRPSPKEKTAKEKTKKQATTNCDKAEKEMPEKELDDTPSKEDSAVEGEQPTDISEDPPQKINIEEKVEIEKKVQKALENDEVDSKDEVEEELEEREIKNKDSKLPPYATAAAKAAAAAQQRAKLDGPERARAVLAAMDTLLGQVQASASQCTALAQMNIKWQKKLDKASKGRYPQAMKEIAKYVGLEVGSRQTPLGLEQCSLQQAIDWVENICDFAQQIAALYAS